MIKGSSELLFSEEKSFSLKRSKISGRVVLEKE